MIPTLTSTNNISLIHHMTGTHGTTFGGSPLACAVGHHVLSRLSSRNFVKQLRETSSYLDKRLTLLPEWFPELLQPNNGVRGRGMIRGIDFKDESLPGKIVQLARERGVLMLTAGTNAVRLVPPLTVGQIEVDLAMNVLESCLSLQSNK
jgi:acetylornithine aminotransferase